MSVRTAAAITGWLTLIGIEAFAAGLPTGFVYLADVAPTIRQDMRYAGGHNFIGRPVAGYEAAECVLTQRAALALARVQRELSAKKLTLVVWDCYRPKRAVSDFMNWARVPDDTRMKKEFYPRTDKTMLFSLGYLATRSAHSRGSTVDLGIMPAASGPHPTHEVGGSLQPCFAPKGQRFEDGTVDLGTGYDCLDVLASTSHPNIGAHARANRLLLRDVMRRNGFRPYSREWWHFELIDEPFPQQSFDFPIVARASVRPESETKAPSFRQIWTLFKSAVLDRDPSGVSNVTHFPFHGPRADLDQVAFIADFDNIFDGDLTACVAKENPKPNAKSSEGDRIVSCRQKKNDKTLVFKIIDGSWRFTAIITPPE